MGGLGQSWRELPSPYKKMVYQGLAAYVAIMVALGGWVAVKNSDAIALRKTSIPHVESEIRAVYLSPQLTDLSNPAFNLADIHTATEPGKIALIMTGMGLSKQTDERAINAMPAPVTLAFSPYGKYSKADSTAAAKDGHKIIALIPMEPTNYPKDDPGTLALLGRNSIKDNQKNIAHILSAVPPAAAGMNYMGSRFLTAEQNADLVFKALGSKKMAFVEAPVSERSVAKSVAKATGEAYGAVDIYIDDSATENDIRSQLSELERISRQRGIAVGVVHPFPLTFTLLDNWMQTLDSRNLSLVDVATAIDLQKNAENGSMPRAIPASMGDDMPPQAPDAPAAVHSDADEPAELKP